MRGSGFGGGCGWDIRRGCGAGFGGGGCGDTGGQTLCGQRLDDGVPTTLEGLDSLLELFVFTFTLLLAPYPLFVFLGAHGQSGSCRGSHTGQ